MEVFQPAQIIWFISEITPRFKRVLSIFLLLPVKYYKSYIRDGLGYYRLKTTIVVAVILDYIEDF
jgi:hypothetical protein